MEQKQFEKIQRTRRLRGAIFAPLMTISPKFATELAYFFKFKKKLNLKKPSDFNEKIQWLKLYYQTPTILKAADKVEVQNILREKGLENYLIPTLGVYDFPEEIEWEKLPQKFVIKTNNASGTNIVVTNKDDLDIQRAQEQLKIWLKTNFSHYALEPQYGEIKPKILIEQFIESNEILYDYRFFCFNGKPEFLYVSIDGTIDESGYSDKKIKKGFFDFDFKRLYFMKEETEAFNFLNKPKNFDEMIRIAQVLAKEFPFVRVDLYNIDGNIRFGEMTFTPSSGFASYYTDEALLELGKKIKLPEKKQIGYGKR